MATTESYFDGREMDMVHRMLRREFGLLPGLVRGVADGATERGDVVYGHARTMAAILHEHHGTEDKYVWPVLLERAPAEIAPTVHLMESHHEQIDKAISEVDGALEAWNGGFAADAGNTVADALERLLPLLHEHLAAEEEKIVPLMERHITAAEWNQAIQQMSADLDPEMLSLALGLAMYEADPDVIEGVFGNMPPEVAAIIREAAPQAFATYSTLLHGTATPPRSTEL
ncbi:hemerythrin domain-containing protein [Microbispora sp. RL4-1S]|uniref:Hemerythrin domain-containing protein n=1 Tax=Microbispora oryzae TaxID=2806554 RepID=A0A940WNE2_9ACTN|nr:hemerythrin domain-containing protein [Microbispora oryzae]MBP2704610.1 hemerythrin domain-containing protein [Microbispora oryzae]